MRPSHIGPSPAAESYLKVDAILEAARKTGADAVHPGYGFLSENAAFAKACADAGVVFIGPPPDAITAMGDKALAKQRMLQAGVPCAPGYLGADQSRRGADARGAQIRLPVAGESRGRWRWTRHATGPQRRRAAARPGGRPPGSHQRIRRWHPDVGALDQTTAATSKIQVFADAHGNAVYLGERDCTAQRTPAKGD